MPAAGEGEDTCMLIGVVADDVTGSNDIGIMFAKWGLQAHVYPYSDLDSDVHLPDRDALPQVCILNTNSRLDAPGEAYRKVHAATLWLKQKGYKQYFNKTCSVFRGNIGAEFDAMLDALDLNFAVVVLGFPKNGRLTLDGIHYVHSIPLEESEFQNDPIHPMRSSNLVDILSAQTDRNVSLLDHRIISQGAVHLRERILQMKTICNYLILDVSNQKALRTIAEAAWDESMFCGSSALAEELPAAWGIAAAVQEKLDLPRPTRLGILSTVGSLMPQTAAQVKQLCKHCVPAFELDTQVIFSDRNRSVQIDKLASKISAVIEAGQDAILQSPLQSQAVFLTQELGQANGLCLAGTGRLISSILAEITALVLERTGQNRLIVAGGETSAAVCMRLGINGLRIWKEIQPGLPSCLSLSENPLLLVLKSGSFGRPDFFERALEHLRAQ